MAHTFDTKFQSTRGTSNPHTFSYTCGVGATLLVLCIIVGGSVDRTGGAPTYNGIPLTQADQNRKAASGPETVVELWYLLNPPTGQAYTVSVPNSDSRSIACIASSYKAASGYVSALRDANGATGTSVNPTGPTHTGLAIGDVIVAVVGSGANTWAPTGRTGVQLYDRDEGNYGQGAQYLITTDTNDKALAWTFGTSDDWAIVSAVFKEVLLVTGTGQGSDKAAVGSASGAHGVSGGASAASSSVTAQGLGQCGAKGEGYALTSGLEGSASGEVSQIFAGECLATTPPPAMWAEGLASISGAASSPSPVPTAVSMGVAGAAGEAAVTGSRPSASSSGAVGEAGAGTGTVRPPTASAAGLASVSGLATTQTTAASAQATGQSGAAGIGDGLLPALEAAASGFFIELGEVTGTCSGQIPSLAASATGEAGGGYVADFPRLVYAPVYHAVVLGKVSAKVPMLRGQAEGEHQEPEQQSERQQAEEDRREPVSGYGLAQLRPLHQRVQGAAGFSGRAAGALPVAKAEALASVRYVGSGFAVLCGPGVEVSGHYDLRKRQREPEEEIILLLAAAA